MADREPIVRRIERGITSLFPSWSASRAGQRVKAAQLNYIAAGYEAAARKNQRSRWKSGFSARTEDAELDDGRLSTIRERSREEWRNNSIYSGILTRAADNIVGTGLQLMPATSDRGLNAEIRAGWEAHTSKGGGWEYTRRWSLKEAQRMAFFSVAREGDLLMFRSDAGWQFFEAAQVGTPLGYNSATRRIAQGVEFSQDGLIDRYWVAPHSYLGYVEMSKATGLRADKCELVHNPQSLTLSRGLPVYHNAIDRFQDLDRYIEADLLGAMAAACIVGSLESPAGPGALDAIGVKRAAPVGGTSGTNTSGSTPRRVDLAPGAMVGLFPGEKFNMHAALRPTNTFPDYCRMNIRILGIPVGMPLEIALMDFGETVFAGAKMAMGQAMVSMMVWQEMVLAQQMIRRIYLDWLLDVSGITAPASVQGFKRFEIIPPPVPWIDPYREAGAINLGLEGNWDTITHIVREHMGRTLEDVMRERADEILLAQEIGREKGVDPERILRKIADFKPVDAAQANAK